LTLSDLYQTALLCVVDAGYGQEIEWVRSRSIHRLTESEFLSELAWCILNAGMRERVVRGVFPYIRKCFWEFESAHLICLTGETCVQLAMIRFGHEKKLKAIVEACEYILLQGGFSRFVHVLIGDPLGTCSRFQYIGPVTIWHLLRNIGVDCAKPDRHLRRLASLAGFRDPQKFCEQVAAQTGERIGVVDIVFWRHQETRCGCVAFAMNQPDSSRRSRSIVMVSKPHCRRPLVCRWNVLEQKF